MKILVDVKDGLADSEVISELRDYVLFGYLALGGLAVEVVGIADETRQPDGFGGHKLAWHVTPLEEM